MAIKDWAESDRPREKLVSQGARHLTDAELLAIVIGSGTENLSALDLSRNILQRTGGLKPLIQLSFRRLAEFPGIGATRYARLQAGVEIARRTLVVDEDDNPNLCLHDTKAAARIVKKALFSLSIETFGCVFLDVRHRILAFEVISEGTVDRAAVYPREIVRRVIDQNATAVIFCHNHPSGQPDPSEADIALTSQLQACLALIDVTVLDHFIVAGNHCLSFADLGLI